MRQSLELQANERFREIADHLPLAIALSNADLSQFFSISRAYEQIWGRTVESLYARSTSFLEGVHPEDRGRVKEALEGLVKGEPVEAIEYRVVRPDGSTCWVLGRGFAIRDAEGQIIRLAGSAEDITKRRRAEEELRRNQERFQAILDNSPHLTFLKDIEGRYLLVNKEFERAYDISKEQIMGKKEAELFSSVQAARFRATDLKAINWSADKQNVVLQQAREDIVRALTSRGLFDDHGNEH